MTLEELERQLIIVKEGVEDILKHVYQEGITVTGGFPEPVAPKKPRKPRRKKAEKEFPAPKPTPKPTPKEYTPDPDYFNDSMKSSDLPDEDVGHTFYNDKPKRRSRKKEVENV